jgi:hypothetical protein
VVLCALFLAYRAFQNGIAVAHTSGLYGSHLFKAVIHGGDNLFGEGPEAYGALVVSATFLGAGGILSNVPLSGDMTGRFYGSCFNLSAAAGSGFGAILQAIDLSADGPFSVFVNMLG